jgi:hypothetical protein
MNKKEWLLWVAVNVVLLAVDVGVMAWATEPEQWYSGMHVEGCAGYDTCGCYEKLLEMDRERAKSTSQE